LDLRVIRFNNDEITEVTQDVILASETSPESFNFDNILDSGQVRQDSVLPRQAGMTKYSVSA
jgi:hypothetical protein